MPRPRSIITLSALLAPLALAGAARAQEPPPDGAETPPPGAASEEPAPTDDGAEPSRPPPKGKGVVWGTVTDAKSKEPLIDAQISVVGTARKAIADLDGRFRLKLPPGTYELRVWYELYKPRRVQNVRVVAGSVAQVDVGLELDKTAEEVIEVEAAPERASAAAQLLIRKNSATVGDAVGAQEIAKTPDKNAAEAAKRVVGTSVVDGKYVYVRGLGERYTNSLLNGTPLPSPEPDRQAVPLDLFPSVVLSDLSIVKTFTPDMPGDFAGGSVRVNTRELPDRRILQATVSAGFNTNSTFAKRLTYQGSSTDWLGIDGGTRQLPDEVPDYKLVRLGDKPDGTKIKKDELTANGRLLNAYMTTRTTTNWPNLSGNVVVGDTHKFGDAKSQSVGYVAALTYGRKFTTRKDEIIRTLNPDPNGGLKTDNDYLAETGLDQVTWGGLATFTYKPHKDHQLTLTGLHTRSADNEGRIIQGFNDERGTDLRDTRLRFVSRSLTFGQLAGEHTLRALDKAVFGWNASLSSATSDEPDTRETVYTFDGTSKTYSFDEGTLSGMHFFAEQAETQYGGGLDWTQPIVSGDIPSKVKLGGLLNKRSRTFDSRRFHYRKEKVVPDPNVFRSPPDELFTDENIGTILNLEEITRENDSYTAEQDLYAGYIMSDANLTRWLRVIVGGRLEASTQTIDSFDPFAAERTKVQGELSTTDLLPAVGLVFRTTNHSNLRLSLARTVARPQLRELAPFTYTDYFGAREITGNPNLRRTSIYNADLRFEIFPTASEVLALSVFYKHFVDPIEQVILPSNKGIISYQNAKAARNAGAEVEARKSLGFLSETIHDVSALANLTVVSSRVELSKGPNQLNSVQTNDTRPLAGQSPFVVNLGLDYSNEASGTRARLLYNVFGRRIARVGSSPLPDEYEQPRHLVDLTVAQRLGKHVDIKLTAENLLDSPVLFTQGDSVADGDTNVTSKYTLGRTFGVGVTVSN